MNTQTKKNEKIETTDNPELMQGKYLSKPLLRKWVEDFVDEASGEVVTIDRKEMILKAGTHLIDDALTNVMFHIQSGDIKEVEVSNQKREGIFVKSDSIDVWKTVIEVNGKNKKLLLYANTAESAIEASRDFIELNYSGMCKTKGVTSFGDYIIIDKQVSEDEQESKSKKVYKFDVVISQDETAHNKQFLVFATDTETGLNHIEDWVCENLNDNKSLIDEDFKVTLETVTVVTCNHIIEKEFSEAYL